VTRLGHQRLLRDIRKNLTDDLLNPKWRREVAKAQAKGTRVRSTGHCYIASEALFHMIGGAGSGYVPQVISYADGSTHWFLRSQDNILDPTRDQYPRRPAYWRARPCGFLTKRPSRRAQELIGRVFAGMSRRGEQVMISPPFLAA
jgi:hypothetical protein